MKTDKLDRIFSEYIRLRDSDIHGIGRCISCGKFVHWKDADCGHFVKRQYMSLRYSEENCNLQCRYCNYFLQGNDYNYFLGLEKKYGEGITKKLMMAKNSTMKFTQFEINELTKYYGEKVKQLIDKL